MKGQMESYNCRDNPMYSFEQIIIICKLSHAAQRNLRSSACCSVRSLSETTHLALWQHLTLLFPMFLGSSLSSLHLAP